MHKIYKFDDIVINVRTKKKPEDSDKLHYIGLEHIEPGVFEFSRWGSDITPKGEKLIMKKGDVLFGKRRAYQKKVAIAPFDGIFSAHGMVLRPKEDVICKEYFPFFISSNQFMDTAMRISVGGLSPTINWKDLQRQEFELPPIEEQRVLADKLWSAYNLKESYKKMIIATDALVKAQFVEMTSNSHNNITLSCCVEATFPGEWGSEDLIGNGIKVIRTTNFRNDGSLDLDDVVKRDIAYSKIIKKGLKKGDILLERSGGTNANPVGRVVYFNVEGTYMFNNFTQLIRCKNTIENLYVFYSLYNLYWSDNNTIRNMGNKTTGIQNLKMDQYWKIPIADLSEDVQKRFVEIYKQANQSKQELTKAINKIDRVIKSLLQ